MRLISDDFHSYPIATQVALVEADIAEVVDYIASLDVVEDVEDIFCETLHLNDQKALLAKLTA